MILSDGEMRTALRKKQIIVRPEPDESRFTSSAVDLILGNEIVELKSPQELQSDQPLGVMPRLILNLVEIDVQAWLQRYGKPVPKEVDGSFLLPPGKFVLAKTQEYIALPLRSKIAARVEGRSTLARVGLLVHFTAPTIHAGFEGHIVLEMCNFSPYELQLFPGKLRICQLIFERLGRIPKHAPRTRWLGQTGIR
ncbi:dCTP deaminase [Candidatus Sumerlaeota bacterium]|nr:dCTP deaminase [Candidatus Sumerlaeota bacterium]